MSKTIYKLYDYYEGKQLVGEYDDWFELKKARKQYIEDTDGECDLDVEEYDYEQGEQKMNALESLLKWCEEFGIPHDVWNSEYNKGTVCFTFGGSEEIMLFNNEGEFEGIEQGSRK